MAAAAAEATRRKFYDMLVAEMMMIQGFHYPFPALGHIEKAGHRLSGGGGSVESVDLISTQSAGEGRPVRSGNGGRRSGIFRPMNELVDPNLG